MIIKVEACWGGHNSYFRINLPDGRRERVSGDNWDRSTAKETLDLLERVYGYKRSNIRLLVR